MREVSVTLGGRPRRWWVTRIAGDVFWSILGKCRQYIGFIYRCRYSQCWYTSCIPMYCDVFSGQLDCRTAEEAGGRDLPAQDHHFGLRSGKYRTDRPTRMNGGPSPRLRALANNETLTLAAFANSLGVSISSRSAGSGGGERFSSDDTGISCSMAWRFENRPPFGRAETARYDQEITKG